MSRYLMDTHTFLWAAHESRMHKLGALAKEAIEDLESELFISSVSIFEIANKYRIGKLSEYQPIAEHCIDAVNGLGARELPLDWEQASLAGSMDWEHKDPFDRMLAAQALTEGLTLITCDKVFEDVPGVNTLW